MNDILEIYKNAPDEEKRNIFNNLSELQKNNLIQSIRLDELKDFMILFSQEEQESILKYFSLEQLLKFYRQLNNDQRETLAFGSNELKNEISDQNTKLKEQSIDQNFENIEQSKENIENSKLTINETKRELRDIKKQLKKLDKQQKKALQKVLSSSKPSKLDKIGFIEKARTNQLIKRIEKLNVINQNITMVKSNENDTIVRQEDAKQQIIDEKENIKTYKQEIKQSTEQIKDNNLKIKKLNSLQRKQLGNRLYRQICKESDIVLARKKQQTEKKDSNQMPIIEETEIKNVGSAIPIEPNQTTNNDNQELENKVKELLKIINKYQETGIEFNNNGPTIGPQNNPNLLDNLVTTITPETLIILGQTLIMNGYQQYYQNNQAVAKARGVINFTLIIAIISSIIMGYILFRTYN